MGTMLQSADLEPGDALERLNADQPDTVLQIHEAYLGSGADVLTTNTFGGNRIRLELHGLADRVRELNLAGAKLARKTADTCTREVIVAGSVGPSGLLLEPVGDLPFKKAKEAFSDQCQALAEGGVDFILIETMGDLEELRAGVEGARSACGLPIFCTMTFDTHGRTMMGASPEEALRAANRLGVQAFGTNCGNGPDETEEIIEKMTELNAGLPIIVQSNAGAPKMQEGGVVYETGPEEMAAHAIRCLGLGARYIGGCCGTTPDHVRAMGGMLRSAAR